ncbi:unnamed protein product [Owenia fusiformis]|uniref:Uncharacterized protein n=1 Tax=Owenia fusiformis TaxID=6347 RepID=A0A8S4NMH6_OWEFU|nr:unnamed protein product [Owenia fusiformis]
MPKIVPYVDNPEVWKKFIRAQVEGRVIEHAGYGKRGKLKWVPVSSVREPIVQHVSPTEAVYQRAKAEIDKQQKEMGERDRPPKRVYRQMSDNDSFDHTSNGNVMNRLFKKPKKKRDVMVYSGPPGKRQHRQ